MRAAIYARYSAGPKQTDQSIEGQLRVCHQYCESKGLEVVAEYCDRHISGRTDDRPKFQEMISAAKNKEFEALVVYKTDRFARDKYDSAVYKRQLKKAGVQIFYAAESIPEGPEGIILESLMEGLAEYYSAELSQKIKRGMRENALKCHSVGSGISLGYKVLPDKSFAIDPEGASLVHEIARMYVSGLSKAEICRRVNAKGSKTLRGKPFTVNSLTKLLKNERYVGVYRYDDIVIKDGMPRILSDEEFIQVLTETERRKRERATPRKPEEYLLSGKLFCGHCQSPMIGVSGTSHSSGVYFYYMCRSQRQKKGCSKKPVPKDYIENLVVDLTKANLLQPDRIEDIAEKIHAAQKEKPDVELKVLKKKKAEIEKAINNIVSAIEQGNGSKALSLRLEQLEADQEAVEKQILQQKRSKFLSKAEISTLLEKFVNLKSKEEIISLFVTKVFLFDDEIKIFYSLGGGEQKFDLKQLASTSKTDSRTLLVFVSGGILLSANISKSAH